MEIKELFYHLLCVSAIIFICEQCSMSSQLKEGETALTKHMIATSRRWTDVMLICHIMNRNIWHQLLCFYKDKKAGSSVTNQSARHCRWSKVEMEKQDSVHCFCCGCIRHTKKYSRNCSDNGLKWNSMSLWWISQRRRGCSGEIGALSDDAAA